MRVDMISFKDTAVLDPSFSRNAFTESFVYTKSADASRSDLGDQSKSALVGHHPDFAKLFLSEANVTVLAEKEYSFAHEAGVYVAEKDEVWITSNLLPADNESGKRVEISRVNLKDGSVSTVEPQHIGLGNGACPYDQGILFCEQGAGPSKPSQLVWVDPVTNESRVVLNNYAGRRFNSLNDVIILPPPGAASSSHTQKSGTTIWFTDPPYGFEQGFRPPLQLPPQIYAFDPENGEVRVVADGFAHPNGIAFSPDGRTCYITDSSHIHGTGRLDPGLPSTIYAFDVVRSKLPPHRGIGLTNRRMFAFADTGVPDGIKCDRSGNVYSGCGDGVHVWNSEGTFLGRILLGRETGVTTGCANFCFAPGGRLVCFAETKVYLVTGLAVEGDLIAP